MDENQHYSQAIFWVSTDKITPNPYQPRREFDQDALSSLADSIRQYGVLQPLVVTRKEAPKEDGGIVITYELIAGERRLRASKIAGIAQVPVLIRDEEDNDKVKLELAIIENIQREDLNPVDRARAFSTLINDFNLKHHEVAEKIGKSREYVSNSVRILSLPEEMTVALSEGKITEGHTRPLLMLSTRPDEQKILFNKILEGGTTVREAETFARRIAEERVRKPEVIFNRGTKELEEKLAERFGTRVKVERKDQGGKISIEFFSADDLENILSIIHLNNSNSEQANAKEETKDEDDLYSIKNFSI